MLRFPLLADLNAMLMDTFAFLGITAEEFRRAVIQIVVIWLLAWLTIRLIRLVSARILTYSDDHNDAQLTYHEKRAQTLAQLLNSVGRFVVILIGIVLTLNQFINVAPLLAGVGILGLAVSFGSQSLVKDVISGFFILMEDQFAIGDVIDAGGKSGVVETMSLRVVKLRDVEGTLHIVPNGQILTVSNRTRGWSRAVLDIGVGYGSDVDEAIAALRDEAAQFGADLNWQSRLDGKPDVIGVQSLGESAISIRVMIRTQPGNQWEAGREFLRRAKIRLDKEGIEIPYPQRTVHVRHHGPEAPDADPFTLAAGS
jgi:small conductance mechanosensitive channel